MPRTRLPHSPEFRQRILELARVGRTPEGLSQEFEPSAQTVRNWMRQSDLDSDQRHSSINYISPIDSERVYAALADIPSPNVSTETG